jgi:hypothetical protein
MAIFGDGRQELVKHLFLANLLYGFTWIYAVSAAVLVAGRWAGWRGP